MARQIRLVKMALSVSALAAMGCLWIVRRLTTPQHGVPDIPSPPLSRWKEIWWPVFLSFVLAIATVVGSFLIQVYASRSQEELTTYQVTFIERQRAYASFFSLLDQAWTAANYGSIDVLRPYLQNFQVSFYAVEPFLPEDHHVEVSGKVIECQLFLASIAHQQIPISDEQSEENVNTYAFYVESFQKVLYEDLFADP